MLIDELHMFLFDGQPHILAESMRTWLTSSRRFSTFVTAFRDKIRKKIRVTQDEETLLDLRLELETAYLLLREKTLSVSYEPEQAGPGRSPDFAVSFTSSLTFMVEVTRLRGIRVGPTVSEDDRLADAICSKLGQFLPQRGNVLIVGVDSLQKSRETLASLMLRIQQRAERNDPAFWRRYGFQDRADFFKHYHRLSEVLVRDTELQPDRPLAAWVNPQAKHPLPSKVHTALYRSHQG